MAMVVSWRKSALGLALLGTVVGACSSSSKSGPSTGGTAGNPSGLDAKGNDTASTNGMLSIVFPEMYSGYDGGSHTFKLPAAVPGLGSGVKWSTTDTSMVSLDDTDTTAAG